MTTGNLYWPPRGGERPGSGGPGLWRNPSLLIEPCRAQTDIELAAHFLNTLPMKIGGVTKPPDFVYLGKDATVSAWPAAFGYGSNLAITGAGAAVTPNCSSPFYGPLSGGVKTAYTGKGFVASANTIYDYTTHDFVFELVCKVPDCSVNDYQRLFLKINASSTVYYGLWAENNAGSTVLRFEINGGTYKKSDSSLIIPNSVTHFIWFVDRSGQMLCYTNGVAGSPLVSAAESLSNTGLFYFLVYSSATYGWTTPVYYAAMYSGIGWLNSHEQPALATERFQRCVGLWPLYAGGTSLAEVL